MQKHPSSIIEILKQYKISVFFLVLIAVLSNGLNLIFPKLISNAIDAYIGNTFNLSATSWEFLGLSVSILVLTFAQGILQTYVSEKSARDLRESIIGKISEQSYMYTQEKTPSYLLTNLTSDVDAVKSFLGVAVPSIISSLFALIGASILILLTDWKLGLGVLSIIPIIGITFFFTFSKMGKLFKKTQEIIDQLNLVINSSIVGAALVRVLNAGRVEFAKFKDVNGKARDNGMKVLMLFSSLIPVVMFASNFASLIILYIGGNFVIHGSMSIGQFAAFNSYISILIFPIFIIGFTSNMIGRAQASMARIKGVLEEPVVEKKENLLKKRIEGDIDVKHLSLKIGEKDILKDVSFSIKKRTKTAIIGPTASGKSQLLALLTGLVVPTSGTVSYDGTHINEYDSDSFYSSVALVFQDSILFNLSLKENIAFGSNVTEENLMKAIKVAELDDFVTSLPQGLDTLVSERGLSLSGGQKQRITLARALATNPSVLYLDDFVARVDAVTEQNILKNIEIEFPDVTLISVTQKISSIERYDQIVLLVEGEVIKTGTHEELMSTTPEYVQIYESQKSTANYELRS
jgi:ATP-binding cassette subfamily B protein